MVYLSQLTSFDIAVLAISGLLIGHGIWVGCIKQLASILALIVGFVMAGRYLYRAPIGFDGTGFLFGGAIDGVVRSFNPDAPGAMVGIVWLVIWLVAITAISVWLYPACSNSPAILA